MQTPLEAIVKRTNENNVHPILMLQVLLEALHQNHTMNTLPLHFSGQNANVSVIQNEINLLVNSAPNFGQTGINTTSILTTLEGFARISQVFNKFSAQTEKGNGRPYQHLEDKAKAATALVGIIRDITGQADQLAITGAMGLEKQRDQTPDDPKPDEPKP